MAETTPNCGLREIYTKKKKKFREREMKITALAVLKCSPEGSDPVILAQSMDVSHFGYFQRSSVKEFIVFVSRTVARRTPPSQRQSVQHEGPFPISSSITSSHLDFAFAFLLLLFSINLFS